MKRLGLSTDNLLLDLIGTCDALLLANSSCDDFDVTRMQRSSVSSSCQDISPYEMKTWQKPDLSNLRIYGCAAEVFREESS